VSGSTTSIGGIVVGISGTTTIDVGATLSFTSATNPVKTFTGNVTVNGVWNESTNAITPTFGANLINNATSWTASTGIHTFSGTGASISGSAITTIQSITVSGTLTNTSTVTCSTALAGVGSFTNGNGTSGTLNFGGTSIAVTGFEPIR